MLTPIANGVYTSLEQPCYQCDCPRVLQREIASSVDTITFVSCPDALTPLLGDRYHPLELLAAKAPLSSLGVAVLSQLTATSGSDSS